MTAVEHRWGDPGAAGSAAERAFRARNIVTIRVGGVRIAVHRELAVIFTALCAGLVSRGHVDLAKKADDWGFANRNVRNGSRKSMHATGQAIDLNAVDNPMGKRATTFPIALTQQLCRQLGLRWGYGYSTRADAMHFEFIGTVAEARRVTAALQRKPQPVKTAARTAARVLRKNPYPAPARVLEPGSTGRDVAWAQWELGLKCDGQYGPVTYRAVRVFQQRHMLAVDGEIGPRTRAALVKDTSR